MTFRKTREISPVRFELEGSPEEIGQCAPGGYVEDANGTKLHIWSVNLDASTIEVGVTVSGSFRMPLVWGATRGVEIVLLSSY